MKRPCLARGCPALVEANRRRCPDHQRAFDRAHNQARPPELRALYSSSAWQRLRAEVVAEGRCYWCGVTAVRLVGDHVVPAIERPDLGLEPDNIVAACYSCSNARRSRRGRTPPRPR